MISPESRLFCRLEQMPGSERERQRLKTLHEFGLLESESIPIFDEATQTVAHSLEAPICILGLFDRHRQWFKSAVGLSRIGLMNDLAQSRQLPRQEAFCTHVVDSQQVLSIADTTANPAFAESILTQRYGIRSYLGVPLLASDGSCLGSLAVMGLSPRQFTLKEAEFLQLVARWSMSEFERNHLLKHPISPLPHQTPTPPAATSTKAQLISQMTQELCTPLTSILGMASVLSQGIYGSLSEKQKEYIAIIHNSGQYLLSLVNEIVELGALDDSNQQLNLNPVDIEMLCQQAIATLNQAAHRREQQIRLTVEPGSRSWLLDKEKVRQMLYHLVFGVIQTSTADSVIRIHVSRKESYLTLTIWTSHPWLGDGLPQANSSMLYVAGGTSAAKQTATVPDRSGWATHDSIDPPQRPDAAEPIQLDASRQSLGLLLSRQLAEAHEGSVVVRGSAEEGYRYVIRLPQFIKEGEKK